MFILFEKNVCQLDGKLIGGNLNLSLCKMWYPLFQENQETLS